MVVCATTRCRPRWRRCRLRTRCRFGSSSRGRVSAITRVSGGRVPTAAMWRSSRCWNASTCWRPMRMLMSSLLPLSHWRCCGHTALPGQRNHVPDFFVRLASGDGRLVDVRAANRVAKNAAQFAMTRQVCDEIGWQYEVFTGLPRVRSQNLRWLAGYRHDRHAPGGDTAGAIRECFAAPVTLRTGLRRASTSTGLPSDVVTAHVLHLLWRQQLVVDLSTPLSMTSEVRA